ncbi:hypothetical protein ANO14919_009550 [Xylariales sp. No.14919]|nr:hypothetical protein ANO14919_009550 [Xylariales sp. No.14919]
MHLSVFAFLIVGASILDIPTAGTINFELEISTNTNLTYPNSRSDHWLPASTTTTTITT